MPTQVNSMLDTEPHVILHEYVRERDLSRNLHDLEEGRRHVRDVMLSFGYQVQK